MVAYSYDVSRRNILGFTSCYLAVTWWAERRELHLQWPPLIKGLFQKYIFDKIASATVSALIAGFLKIVIFILMGAKIILLIVCNILTWIKILLRKYFWNTLKVDGVFRMRSLGTATQVCKTYLMIYYILYYCKIYIDINDIDIKIWFIMCNFATQGITDQYSDGKAAKVWQLYIG